MRNFFNEPLLYIIQRALESKKVPFDWKKANVTAI